MSSKLWARALRSPHRDRAIRNRVIARAAEISPLEPRKHFSVTAAQLAGPLTNGAVYTYSVASATGGSGTQTFTLKNPSAFNGAPAIEEDIAGPGTGDLNTSTSFYATDLSAGFRFLGTTQAGTTYANSAGAVMFPASLTAAQPVTNTYTQTSTDFSADIQVSNTLESESLAARTIGNTTYHVYVVDQTVTETFDVDASTTTTYKYFIDPAIGTVESDTTDGGGHVTVVQLTSVTGLRAGAGYALAPTIDAVKGLSAATPTVAGGKTSASVTVGLTNTGSVSATGKATVALYLSPDSSAADGTFVQSATSSGSIKPSAKRAVSVRLKTLPSLTDGNYFLVAQVTDANGNISSVASANPFPLRAPFASLVPISASLKTARNGTGTLTYSVQNKGNVPYANTFATTLIGSPDAIPADATSILTAPNKKKSFAVNKPQKITLKLTAAQVTAYQADAAAYLALQITDAANNTQTLSLAANAG